jgi:hypothetical protein
MSLSDLLKDPFIVRNVVFGLEDSIISTTGVLVGIAAAKFKRREVLVAGFILILVEAMSMSYGAFLSEESFLKTAKQDHQTKQVIGYAIAMFVSYFGIGLILLAPFWLDLPFASAWTASMAMIFLTLLIMVHEHDPIRVSILAVIGGILMTISVLLGKNM